jgi:GAF domain-containing protein
MRDSIDHRNWTDDSVELQTAREQAGAARAEAEVLRKAIATLAQNLRMDSLLDALLRCVLDVIPYDSAAVLFTEEGDRLFVAREAPPAPDRQLVVTMEIDENPLVQRIVLMKKDIFLADTNEEADWRTTGALGSARCWVAVPFVMHNMVLGLLSVSSREPHLFTEEHFRMAKILAVPMAVAVQNARLYEWAQIYSEERAELIRRAGTNPVPNDQSLPN